MAATMDRAELRARLAATLTPERIRAGWKSWALSLALCVLLAVFFYGARTSLHTFLPILVPGFVLAGQLLRLRPRSPESFTDEELDRELGKAVACVQCGTTLLRAEQTCHACGSGPFLSRARMSVVVAAVVLGTLGFVIAMSIVLHRP